MTQDGPRAEGARALRRWLVLGSALALAACAGDPQPGPGTQPTPKPAGSSQRSGSPASSPSPASSGLSRPESLRYQATEHGLLIQDPVTGFSLTTPGAARPASGGGEGALAYELQAKRRGWALRIRREVTPKGRQAAAEAERLVHARAIRKPVEVSPFRAGTCARWGVEAAVSGTYPLGQGEAWERVIVLVRASRVIVLWETVDVTLGRPLITELNGRCYASFRWGGPPRVMARTPSPFVDAEARLTAQGERLAQDLAGSLPADDLARAEDLLGRLAYSAVDPPDEAIHARDRALVEDKLGGLGEAAAGRLRQVLGERVRTPRDLRGLQQVLARALR